MPTASIIQPLYVMNKSLELISAIAVGQLVDETHIMKNE